MATNTEPDWYLDMLTKMSPQMSTQLTRDTDIVDHGDQIIMYVGSEKALEVRKDGFWVRGKKVEQDDKEAEEVYNAFKQWLAWKVLNTQ